MGDVTGSVLQAISVFSLFNDLVTFIKASYKKLKEEWKGKTNTKRLQAINETRWWAKCKESNHVLGSFEKPNKDCLYVKVLMAIISIAFDENQGSTMRKLNQGDHVFDQDDKI